MEERWSTEVPPVAGTSSLDVDDISDAETSISSNDGEENLCSSDLSNIHRSPSENAPFSPKIENIDASAALVLIDTKIEPTSTLLQSSVEETVQETANIDKNPPQHIVVEHAHPPTVPERQPDPRIPPKVDCPEKIVFCIDMSSDMNEPPFKLGNGGQFSPLCMVKRVIEIFVHSKLKIDNRHEFAVMGFHETAIWVKDFTNDVKELSAALDELNEVKPCQDSALSSIFTLISVVASDLPSFSKPEIVPPPFVFRVILIYGRSNCVPQNIENIDALSILKASPYFYLDILYIHETPSTENKCQEIFECLCDLDENDTSYIFEVARNTTKLHNCMAKLLAHPLQRPLQKYTYYKLQNAEVKN